MGQPSKRSGAGPTVSDRTEFRDYFGPDGVAEVTVLADYVGDREGHGPLRSGVESLVRSNSAMVGGIAGIPGQWARDVEILRDPLDRKMLWRALGNEALLTQRRRQTLVSVIIWSFLVAWAVTGIVVAVAARPALADFKATGNLFVYGVATSLFLPLPFETLLTTAARELGIIWTVIVAALSKVAGAVLVLLMGDKASTGLERSIRRYPALQAGWRWLQLQAQKYGYTIVFLMFAFPFMSDTLPLFLFAVMHMRKSIFLAVTFVAICIRCLIFFFLWDGIQAIIAVF